MSLFGRLVVTTLPLVPKFIVGKVAARYVAGETREDAFRVVRQLNEQGAMATMDLLGEEVTERSKAESAVEEYIRLFEDIQKNGADSNVSIKPTLLGLKVDAGFCLENVERIAQVAKDCGNFLRIDMEDHTCTDETLEIYHRLQPRLGNLGVVFQSYMRRTLNDIAALPEVGANVRLCKGIYIEPRLVAWKGYETVRLNFIAALEKMLSQNVYVAIATHDEHLVCASTALIHKFGLSRDQYEFQMLLGVDEELRRVLIARGHRVRIYVPYGRDWYPYSTRRLRENPEVARHIIKGLLGRR